MNPLDRTLPPLCYISGRGYPNVVFADETPSKTALYDAISWVKPRFAYPPHLDLTDFTGYPEPPNNLLAFGSQCDGIYGNNTLSMQHCGVMADSVLRRYARTYRNDPINIINTYGTFTSTPYLLLYVDFPVYPASNTYLLGRTFHSNWVPEGVSYVFAQQHQKFVDESTGIQGYSPYKTAYYFKNALRWTVAHELGHLLSDLTEAYTAGKHHETGVPCIMLSANQNDVVGAANPEFCSDGDSDTLNTCTDNLATTFHLWSCAQ